MKFIGAIVLLFSLNAGAQPNCLPMHGDYIFYFLPKTKPVNGTVYVEFEQSACKSISFTIKNYGGYLFFKTDGIERLVDHFGELIPTKAWYEGDKLIIRTTEPKGEIFYEARKGL